MKAWRLAMAAAALKISNGCKQKLAENGILKIISVASAKRKLAIHESES
jgi:hypothetical protein